MKCKRLYFFRHSCDLLVMNGNHLEVHFLHTLKQVCPLSISVEVYFLCSVYVCCRQPPNRTRSLYRSEHFNWCSTSFFSLPLFHQWISNSIFCLFGNRTSRGNSVRIVAYFHSSVLFVGADARRALDLASHRSFTFLVVNVMRSCSAEKKRRNSKCKREQQKGNGISFLLHACLARCEQKTNEPTKKTFFLNLKT